MTKKRTLLVLFAGVLILAPVLYWLFTRSTTGEQAEAPKATAPALTDPGVSVTVESADNPETAGQTEPLVATVDEDQGVMLLDDATWADLMPRLLSRNVGVNQEARSQLAQSGDPRAIAVMIELLRATQLQLIRGTPEYYGMALDDATGETLGADWAAWVEWYGATDLEPPLGFTAWKGELLSPIDPGFAEFLYADAPSRARVEEIQWGGVTVDGIPALDNPAMLTAAEADYLGPEEPVFGLAINGEARAYPLRIMDWHEMANDLVGGVPVSIAYCTLCGAAIAYDGNASNGDSYTFGSSGFLYRSNKLMYDRKTRTLWNQLTGQPVLGPLVEEEVTLNVLPIVLTSWADWQSRHPDTLVLDIDTGFERPYETGAAYGDYFSDEGVMFPVWQRADLLDTKDQIFALNIAGVPKAYPLDVLTMEQVVNDTVGELPVVLVATRGLVDVAGESLRTGAVTYQAGGEVRAYERGEHTFSAGPDPDTVLDENREAWRVGEDDLIGPDGERLPRLGGHLAYWFGWYAFFPQTLVYGE